MTATRSWAFRPAKPGATWRVSKARAGGAAFVAVFFAVGAGGAEDDGSAADAAAAKRHAITQAIALRPLAAGFMIPPSSLSSGP
ncbi:hypothetical protein RBXJA2T_05223 [Rubrivivax benzoatilyticus JA2 = ATCC BAA-35]|nr:hypothetical protein [Rubrivivax benzoatilyticus]EGJ09706.1 hypothetical protein RBXJA2T_05223 [Rubrivivax benzoatilyticus JA2 = ATCC BAA-35]